jgi:hypothetical protein
MTIRQITEYEQIAERLHAARTAKDHDTVRRLTHEVEDAWTYLLLIDPMRKENVYKLIEFFLGQIEEDPKEDLLNQQCKWKILALARSLAENPTNIHHTNLHRI